MTLWMIANVAFATFMAFFGALGERAATRFGMPRRFVWIIVVTFAIGTPLAEALRSSRAASPAGSSARLDDGEDRDVGTTSIAAASVSIVRSRSDQSKRIVFLTELARRGDGFIVTLWSVVSFVLLVRLFGSLLLLRRESCNWLEVHEQIGSVWLTPSAGPAVTGLLRPRIVMPQWMLDEDPATRAMLLRHELEHVRAGDTRVLFAGAVLDAVLPWNLPVRWMLQRLRLAIEIDCDQRVIRAVGGAGRYGLALLRVGERHAAPLPIAACLHSSMIDLEVRIRAMAGRPVRRPMVGTAIIIGIPAIAMSAGAWMPWPRLRVARTGESAKIPFVVLTAHPHWRPALQGVEQERPRIDSVPKPPISSSAMDVNSRQPLNAAPATPAAVADHLAPAPSSNSRAARLAADSLPLMREVRDWIAQYHPNVVTGDPHVNRVTVVVDRGGRYMRSLTDSVTEDVLTPPEATRFFRARTGFGAPSWANASRDVAHPDTASSTPRVDLDPWRHVGVARDEVENMMFARSRAGGLVPYALAIIVLQVRRDTSGERP